MAAQKAIFADIESTMQRMGIRMDTYFKEHSLFETNRVWETLDRLREQGHVYDKDDAVWFKSRELGKDKDSVLVKSTGAHTYRLPGIAYHAEKLLRGFD